MTSAVRAIIFTNIGVFLTTLLAPRAIITLFGLSPVAVLQHGQVWQLATYLFIHSPTSISHILFNMLAVWMFGVELERRWGTRFFTKYYFVCGIGAGVCTILASLLPFASAQSAYYSVTDRRLGSRLRPPGGLGPALPGPADPLHVHLPDVGAHVRPHHRGDRVRLRAR